jgi:hypothetical protein
MGGAWCVDVRVGQSKGRAGAVLRLAGDGHGLGYGGRQGRQRGRRTRRSRVRSLIERTTPCRLGV